MRQIGFSCAVLHPPPRVCGALGGASNGKGGVLEESQAGPRWLLPVLLSCGAVLLPLVSLHHEARPGKPASGMDASPSSLELAAGLVPEGASRSAPRVSVESAAL